MRPFASRAGWLIRDTRCLYAWSIILFVLIWAIIANFLPPKLFPPPVKVGKAVIALFQQGEVWDHLLHTLLRVVVGFCLAELFGIIIGVIMGLNNRLEKIGDVWTIIFLTIPGLSYAIFTLLLFGLSEFALIIAVAITTVPYITVNIWGGVKAIDTKLLQMARVFRVSRKRTITKIIIPQILPYIFSSVRYGIGIAWKVVVVVEMLGSGNGVGYMLHYSFSIFSMEKVCAWTVVIVAVMLFIEIVMMRFVETKVLHWRPRVEI